MEDALISLLISLDTSVLIIIDAPKIDAQQLSNESFNDAARELTATSKTIEKLIVRLLHQYMKPR